MFQVMLTQNYVDKHRPNFHTIPIDSHGLLRESYHKISYLS